MGKTMDICLPFEVVLIGTEIQAPLVIQKPVWVENIF